MRSISIEPILSAMVARLGTITDLKLAPFHLLASEGKVHAWKQHTRHMEALARLCADPQSNLPPFRSRDRLENRSVGIEPLKRAAYGDTIDGDLRLMKPSGLTTVPSLPTEDSILVRC